MLSKELSSTIFWVFGMTRPGIEPRMNKSIPLQQMASSELIYGIILLLQIMYVSFVPYKEGLINR